MQQELQPTHGLPYANAVAGLLLPAGALQLTALNDLTSADAAAAASARALAAASSYGAAPSGGVWSAASTEDFGSGGARRLPARRASASANGVSVSARHGGFAHAVARGSAHDRLGCGGGCGSGGGGGSGSGGGGGCGCEGRGVSSVSSRSNAASHADGSPAKSPARGTPSDYDDVAAFLRRGQRPATAAGERRGAASISSLGGGEARRQEGQPPATSTKNAFSIYALSRAEQVISPHISHVSPRIASIPPSCHDLRRPSPTFAGLRRPSLTFADLRRPSLTTCAPLAGRAAGEPAPARRAARDGGAPGGKGHAARAQPARARAARAGARAAVEPRKSTRLPLTFLGLPRTYRRAFHCPFPASRRPSTAFPRRSACSRPPRACSV